MVHQNHEDEKNSSEFFEASAKEIEDIPMDFFSHQSCRWHDCCPRERLKFE